MAQAAEPVSPKESRLGGLSLFCLAVGVVGPFLDTRAVVFLVLALVLGILSRHSRAGRVGLIGSAVTLGIGLLLVVILFFQPAAHPVASPLSPPRP